LPANHACAFSQENLRGGADNSAFTDPDNQVRNFGSGAQPFGPSGPVVQFGAQRGPLTPFGRFQDNNYNNPSPEPYGETMVCGSICCRQYLSSQRLSRTFPRQRGRQPDVMVSGNLPPPALLGAHRHEQGAKESAI
jgi:hypothetical protein